MTVLAARPARIRAVLADRLVGGSLVMLVNTGVLAGFGLVFWTVAARLFTDQQVGAFPALVSGVNLLATVAAVGVPNLLIRYLKNSDDQRRLVAGSLAAVGGIGGLAAAAAVGVVAALHLRVFTVAAGALLLVIGFVVVTAVSAAVDAGLVAISQTVLLAKKNVVGGVLKVGLLFAGPALGAATLPVAYATGAAVPVVIGLVALVRHTRPGTGPRPSGLRARGRFSALNYAGTLFGILPSTVVPIIVFAVAGPAPAAWFAVASLPIGFLNFVPSVVSQVYFAQASATGERTALVRRAAKLVFGLLTPAVALLLAGAPYLMAVFGRQYVEHATTAVRGLAIASLCGAANYLVDATVIAADRVVAYVALNALNAALVLGLAAALVGRGVGVLPLGLAAAQALSLLAGLGYLRLFPLGRPAR